MIVVADTTPINYLILIGAIDALHVLYGQVVIPPAVLEELMRPKAPEQVRIWVAQPPCWFKVHTPRLQSDAALAKLDDGERDAIALAEELQAKLLIVDEILGRREAERRGLPVIGTLGILREAADRGILDLRSAIEKLRGTSFHISPALLAMVLDNRL